MFKRIIYVGVAALWITACSNLKNTQRSLNSGNYDFAIDNSLAYLQKNKQGNKSEEYYSLLHESYVKAVDKDVRDLNFLNQDPNPESLEKTYNIYVGLDKRQNKIRPLLPIAGYQFQMNDYSKQILDSRTNLTNYLYNKASAKLNEAKKTKDKIRIREANEDLRYIQSINPNFKNVSFLIDESHNLGTDFMLVKFKNNTNQIIPKRLEDDLLNVDQYNLDNYWTVHQSLYDKNVKYDYLMELSYDELLLTPEKVKEVFINQEKEIVDGKTYVLDERGNVKKDANGNDIKVDKLVKIQSVVHQHTQEKSCLVKARATFKNYANGQVISAIPFQSDYLFSYQYATYSGDKRALTQVYLDMILRKEVPFPTNETMILDASNDVKKQLQNILRNQKF